VPEAVLATEAVAAPHAAFGTAVAGLGIALPDTVVTNDEVAARIGKDARWIQTRTGIESRRVLAADERLAGLAARAAEGALADAGVAAGDLDLVLLATASGDDIFPAVAAEVCGIIGAHRAAGLDVSAACTGFLSCIQLAGGLLEAGRATAVLVIGAEKLSAITDPEDKRTAMLFADAAGAMVLTRTDAPGELGPVVLRTEAHRDLLYADRDRQLIEMDGHEVFKHAVARMTEATQEALDAAGVALEDIDLFVYHQANARIVRSVGQRLGLEPGKVVDAIADVGNVSAASLPLALAAARADGRLTAGTRVLLSAFGAGFVWGASVLDWKGSASS
jgi:3-oxoacyl-[acyl-carrier-protein] synthase-3